MTYKKNSHAQLSEQFNTDEARVNWHDETLWWIRKKRDRAAGQLPEWEELRETASQIKNNVLSHLNEYLIQFEENAKKNGMVIHWAAGADEHNSLVHSILQKHRITSIVKSKSMLTEECHLNEYLYERGIEVIDTDLGERIVQLAKEPPSHIVLPCIHWKKEEIGNLFHEHLGTPAGVDDPQFLTNAARQDLRGKFLTSVIAVTGVNFAVAETGEFVVCTNEGNADMGAHLADVHIAAMGIEKIIPERKHLAVFLRLLARSATGQPITTYSSHFRRPRKNQELHVIIVDNGRSTQLGRSDFRSSLKCIRCAACFNTCPVYRRSGGHSYHTAIAGPLGSILAPNLNMKQYADLPFASTLCGSCSNVCPVKIDIHNQLYKWRQVLGREGHINSVKKAGIKVLAFTLNHQRFYKVAGKAGRWVMRNMSFILKNKMNPWFKQRDLPKPPKQSFTEWYTSNKSGK